MTELLKVLLLLTIFLIPLLSSKHGFEQTKVIFFFIMTSVAGLIWLYLIYQKKLQVLVDKITLLGLTLISWFFITSLLGVDPLSSLIGTQPYLQGSLTYLFLFLFFLILKSSQISFKEIATVLTVSAAVVSLVAIKEWVFINLLNINIPSYGERVVSTFGQPNLYAGYLLFSIPWQYYLGFEKKWIKLTLLVSILAVSLSESRAAIFLLSLLLIWWLFKKSGKMGLASSLILLFLLGFLWLKQEIIIPQDSTWLKYNSPEKRIFIWPTLYDSFLKRPLTGWGLENITTAFNSFERFHSDRAPAYYGIKNLLIDRSHNYTLDLLIYSGLVGFSIWVFLIWQIFKTTESRFLKICLIIYLFWIQLQVQGIIHLLYFWILASLAIDKKSKSMR
jgi:O-antigen ligase